jgi:fructose-bisphosphate aldolase class I
MADDKGLLAMDESTPTSEKRFAELDIPQTEEARRCWRELIITTPRLAESISGAILYDPPRILHEHKSDEYVSAALELFASMALLLWYVIRILMGARKD